MGKNRGRQTRGAFEAKHAVPPISMPFLLAFSIEDSYSLSPHR